MQRTSPAACHALYLDTSYVPEQPVQPSTCYSPFVFLIWPECRNPINAPGRCVQLHSCPSLESLTLQRYAQTSSVLRQYLNRFRCDSSSGPAELYCCALPAIKSPSTATAQPLINNPVSNQLPPAPSQSRTTLMRFGPDVKINDKVSLRGHACESEIFKLLLMLLLSLVLCKVILFY
jgi:hypothetical protein